MFLARKGQGVPGAVRCSLRAAPRIVLRRPRLDIRGYLSCSSRSLTPALTGRFLAVVLLVPLLPLLLPAQGPPSDRVAVASAVSYKGTMVPDSLATGFGSNLAPRVAQTGLHSNSNLFTELAGSSASGYLTDGMQPGYVDWKWPLFGDIAVAYANGKVWLRNTQQCPLQTALVFPAVTINAVSSGPYFYSIKSRPPGNWVLWPEAPWLGIGCVSSDASYKTYQLSAGAKQGAPIYSAPTPNTETGVAGNLRIELFLGVAPIAVSQDVRDVPLATDITSPTTPAFGGIGVACTPASCSISFGVTASDTGSGMRGFKIAVNGAPLLGNCDPPLRDGSRLSQSSGSLSVEVRDLQPGTTYQVTAIAYDNVANASNLGSSTIRTPVCASSYAINPSSAKFPASGGTGSVTVAAPAGCLWQASSGAGWMTITSCESGCSGNGRADYTVAAYHGTSPRSGTMSIAGQPFPVTQEGVRTLTINSSNPNSGVSIGVSRVDNDGQGSGTTPFTRNYNSGTPVTLTAAPTAGGNNFQKWLKDGSDAGTSVTLQVTMDAEHVLVAVYFGSCTVPTITTQPAGQSINSGLTATLGVVASGTSPLSYQWYQGVPLDTSTPLGSNSSSYTTLPLTTTTSYWVRVSNACGSANSTVATISLGTCSGPEPSLSATVNPGFYIAASTIQAGGAEGYWEMSVEPQKDQRGGGFIFGGGIQEKGMTPYFAAFLLSSLQEVLIQLNPRVLPGGDASKFSVCVRLLDGKRQQIGTERCSTAFIQFWQTLLPDFYIIEVRSGGLSPRGYAELLLGEKNLPSGLIVGGFLSSQVPGFIAFSVAQRQEVWIKAAGRNTFVGDFAASCLCLTLYDANRNVVATSCSTGGTASFDVLPSR